MTVMLWLVTGFLVAWVLTRKGPYGFPNGREACLAGGTAGGFMGGGFYAVATDAPGILLVVPSVAAAVAGALLIGAAVGWAGTDANPGSRGPASRDGRNRRGG